MEDAQIGWIAAIIIGGLAGWLAEMFMKSNNGIFMNIILGIIGAVVANFLLGLFNVILTGWIGYLIAGLVPVFSLPLAALSGANKTNHKKAGSTACFFFNTVCSSVISYRTGNADQREHHGCSSLCRKSGRWNMHLHSFYHH